MIDVLKNLLNADMAVCDISGRNANVLYELGIRQAFNMPVTIVKDDITPELFDTFGIRYAPYHHNLRVDRIQEEINDLAERITETFNKRDEDVFSLVQLLGREKATFKPSNLSDDVKIILEAISGLRDKRPDISEQTLVKYFFFYNDKIADDKKLEIEYALTNVIDDLENLTFHNHANGNGMSVSFITTKLYGSKALVNIKDHIGASGYQFHPNR